MPEICPKCGGNLDYPPGGPVYEEWDKWVEWTPLIGATPELYAALNLISVAPGVTIPDGGINISLNGAMVLSIKAALKKARGE